MNCLDLFSGAGLMHMGTEQAGFKTIRFCEIDKYCHITLKENFPDIPIEPDVKDLKAETIPEPLKLICGGSPCQSYSNMGDRAGLDSPNGQLLFEYFRLVRDLQPCSFLFENVPGLKSISNGKVVQMISSISNSIGYDIYPAQLNTKNYGLPQNRKRLFIVGFRKQLNIFGFEFPAPVPLKLKLIDLCEENVDEKYYLKGDAIKYVTNNLRIKKKYTQIDGDVALTQRRRQYANSEGTFVTDEKPDHKIKINPEVGACLLQNQFKNSSGNFIAPELIQVGAIGHNNSEANRIYDSEGISCGLMGNAGGGGGKTGLYIVGYTRDKNGKDISYHLKEESNTLKNQSGNTSQYLLENTRIRRLTPRECFRLQGAPDSFKLVCSDSQLYRQAGNGVSVPVISAIATQIKYYLQHHA